MSFYNTSTHQEKSLPAKVYSHRESNDWICIPSPWHRYIASPKCNRSPWLTNVHSLQIPSVLYIKLQTWALTWRMIWLIPVQENTPKPMFAVMKLSLIDTTMHGQARTISDLQSSIMLPMVHGNKGNWEAHCYWSDGSPICLHIPYEGSFRIQHGNRSEPQSQGTVVHSRWGILHWAPQAAAPHTGWCWGVSG